MSKIYQYSNIGALMSNYNSADIEISTHCNGTSIGLGCAENINAELTVYQGQAYVATAHRDVEIIENGRLVPFYQITDFDNFKEYQLGAVDHKSITDEIRKQISIDNIFLAITVHASFSNISFRRPKYSTKNKTADEVAKNQEVSNYENINGKLIGFWTPKLFGLISVPGFHFHFLSDDQLLSGHVLSFSTEKATAQIEEKYQLEITNPNTEEYKKLKIEVESLSQKIDKIEN